MIHRIVKIPEKSSYFLFGPRQTGKSTFINSIYSSAIWKVNLLLSDVLLKYSKDSSQFRKEAEEKINNEGIEIIFIDEVQKIPALLDEVHYLIEKYPKCRFVLTGSSARKLKRGGANLLAGRAVERHLFPFVYEEIQDKFDLDTILLFGSLPALFEKSASEKQDILKAYVNTYLKEEILSEGIIRNLGGFSRFLDIAASQFGELVNFSNIARECSVPVRTVQSYYSILEDTLLGFSLQAYRKSARKRMSAHSKFYFFDNGVTNAVNKQLTAGVDSFLKGRLFEQFIILEAYRKLNYNLSEANMFFWKTSHGAEVDLLIEKHGKIIAAFEIKAGSNIGGANLMGIKAFKQEHAEVPCFIVCTAENAFDHGNIKVLPWKSFLSRLNEWL